MYDQALSDVKVIELCSYITGPYCCKMFADYGADVIKVEKPVTGDGARRLSPFAGDEKHPEKSGVFLNLNTSKRGITLNLKSEIGVQIFTILWMHEAGDLAAVDRGFGIDVCEGRRNAADGNPEPDLDSPRMKIIDKPAPLFAMHVDLIESGT